VTRVRVIIGSVAVTGTLNESQTAKRIAAALPLESTAQRWGDEVYFTIPLALDPENAQANVASGTIAYWPPGSALCLFFGQTPYSPVNVVGHLDGDPRVLAAVTDGQTVRVEREST